MQKIITRCHLRMAYLSLLLSAQHVVPCQIDPSDGTRLEGNILYVDDVPENIAVGKTVASLNLSGCSTDDVVVLETSAYLGFDRTSGQLRVLRRLHRRTTFDREHRTRLACACGGATEVTYLQIVVVVTDVNDHSPVFVKDTYTIEVIERTKVGKMVKCDLHATDGDPTNRNINYDIVSSTHEGYFSLPHPTVLTMRLDKALDYEMFSRIDILLVATDNHSTVPEPLPPRTSTVTIIVNITDEDDLNPQFTQTQYNGTVSESDLSGTPVRLSERIKAHDLDSLNTSVVYSIYSGEGNPDADFFNIDNITADVTLKKDALRRGRTYCVLVKARQVDHQNRYDVAMLSLRPLQSAWNPPKFLEQQLDVSVMENMPLDSPIATAAAIDNDPNTSLRYSLSGNPTAMEAFAIDPTSGEITTVLNLDHEVVDVYHLTADVTDGEHGDVLPVTVRVLNMNDNNPEFSLPEYEFTCYNERFSTVGGLRVTDDDGDTDFTFRILNDMGVFAIDNQGVIIVKSKMMDSETLDEPIRLTVVVRDSDPHPRQATVSALVHFVPRDDDLRESSNKRRETKATNDVTIGVSVAVIVVVCGATVFAVWWREARWTSEE